MPVTQLSPATAPTETPQLDFDIAIAGGGIVGATLASALKDSGLKIAIIETQLPEVAATKKQAYAITLLSGMILEGIGVWQQILPQITTFEQINLCDGDYPKIVEFHRPDLGNTGKLPVPKSALGYVGEHQVMLSALHECLATNPNFSWVCPAEVLQVKYLTNCAEIDVKQNGKTRTIRTKLLIAADGSKSRIRTAANIKTRGWKYWQSCVAITVKAEKEHNDIAFERFWPSGPMGVLPLPGNRCQIVWTAPHPEAKYLQEMDKTEFLKLLKHRTGGVLGNLELESDRYLFPVQLMQSDRYVLPRLALIGDAAHCCHPVGGQGLNMGIRDAGAIAQILQQAHQKGEDIGDLQVLKRYHNWRKQENLVVLGFTDFLDRLFSNTWGPIVAFRRFGLWCLRSVPPVRFLALRLMTGLMGRPPELAQN
ncbi:MAG: FAD-dependent hydroxylase [Microcoleus sp. SU_5_6]|nr:FAD-dependent hydroxylase [Microcoleus sp. SU_5_6]NJL67698.1 FAD-dependent hydroxylase [Microcoleus sp. SM1_3_4]